MKVEDFKKLMEKAKDDCTMPDSLDGFEKLNEFIPTLTREWSSSYAMQRFTVEKLKQEQKQMYGQKYKYYRYNAPEVWESTKEIESQISCDPDYVKISKQLNEQQYFLDEISGVYEIVKKITFTVNKYFEYKKITTTNF